MTYEVEAEETLPVAVFGEGSIFGELELLMNCSRQFSVFTVTDSVILNLDKNKFASIFFKQYPKLGASLEKLVIMKTAYFKSVVDSVNAYLTKESGTQSSSKVVVRQLIPRRNWSSQQSPTIAGQRPGDAQNSRSGDL